MLAECANQTFMNVKAATRSSDAGWKEGTDNDIPTELKACSAASAWYNSACMYARQLHAKNRIGL